MRTLLRFAVLSCVLATGFGAAPPAPDDRAVGLWSYQASYPVGPAGELVITREGARWHATLAGAAADGTATGRDIRIAFAGDGGEFRGTLDRGVLHGFWIRPAGKGDRRYAAGSSVAYAGSLDLRAAGPGRWQAAVTPLSDDFTLYLKIFRDTDGTLKAAFRNPQAHSHGPAMQFAVTQTGDALRFSAQPNPPQPEVHLDASLEPGRISLFWHDLNQTIALTRTTPEAATRFFASPPGAAPYVYRVPPATGDGWRVARARDTGIDEAALARMVQRIMDIDPTAARGAWLIHSIAIAHHGKLVLDEYFYGYGRDEPHDTRSASKTFSSVILGALMLNGAKLSPATRMVDVMGRDFANPDPRKDRITLGHLLTHSAGLACDDNAGNSLGDEETIQADLAHPDWTKVTLDLPMAYEPGAHYAYCSMNINLAGAMLSRATGEWLPELFDRTIARPLQFGPYHWDLQGSGEGYLGGGVYVRTRDFLKLGQTFLDGGVWNGRRIVSADWVKVSTGPHMHISPETTGLQGDAFRQVYWEGDDAYAWHMASIKSGDQVYTGYHANGNGGQLLIVVPQFDLAVMFTAGNYGQGLWNNERDNILGGMIIPAIQTPTP